MWECFLLEIEVDYPSQQDCSFAEGTPDDFDEVDRKQERNSERQC